MYKVLVLCVLCMTLNTSACWDKSSNPDDSNMNYQKKLFINHGKLIMFNRILNSIEATVQQDSKATLSAEQLVELLLYNAPTERLRTRCIKLKGAIWENREAVRKEKLHRQPQVVRGGISLVIKDNEDLTTDETPTVSEAEKKAFEKLLYYFVQSLDEDISISKRAIPMLNMLVIMAPTEDLMFQCVTLRALAEQKQKDVKVREREAMIRKINEHMLRKAINSNIIED